MNARWAAALSAVLACAPVPREMSGTEARAEGVWHAEFTLERSPAASVDVTRATAVRGTLALLTHYGTYDVDFTPFGFDPRDAGTTPALVADLVPGDSIALELADARRGTVLLLRGKLAADSVVGVWTVYVARDAGGRGRFVLRRKPLPARLGDDRIGQ